MPFVSNDQTPEEEDKTNQPIGGQGPISPTGGGGAVHLSPSSAVPTVGGGGTAGATGQASGPANAGGSFASLDKYLSANQGQAAPLTGRITDSVNNQYNGLDAANNATIAGLNSQVTNAPGYTASDPNVLSQEAANPVSFASDAGNVKNFQNLLNNSYNGITSAEGTTDYTNQQGAINNAIATGQQNTSTEAGRENLLVQNEATPTTGVTALNSAIISQDPNSLSSIEAAYKPFNNLLTNLSTGAAGVDTTIGNEQADAAASSAAANKAIADQNAALTNAVTTQTQNAQDAGTAQNAQILADVKSQNLSPQDLATLSVTQDQWNALMNQVSLAQAPRTVYADARQQVGATTGAAPQDLTQYLTQVDPKTAFTNANEATKDQYALAGALQTLQGTGLNTIINNGTIAQAGTAPVNLNTLDTATATTVTTAVQRAQLAAAQAFADDLQNSNDTISATHAAQVAASQVLTGEEVGAGVGTIAGAIIGSYIPVIGTAAGAAIGGAIGSVAGNTGGHLYQRYANELKDPMTAYADIATGGAYNTIKAGIDTIKDIFCFHPDTLIEMRSGMLLPICRIEVGDIIRGGKVLATTRAIGHDFYWYEGVLVTGGHAVNENGIWLRVKDSKLALPVPGLIEIVHSLVTEKHRIYANGVEFADQHETDLYESLDLDESIGELNKNAKYVG